MVGSNFYIVIVACIRFIYINKSAAAPTKAPTGAIMDAPRAEEVVEVEVEVEEPEVPEVVPEVMDPEPEVALSATDNSA